MHTSLKLVRVGMGVLSPVSPNTVVHAPAMGFAHDFQCDLHVTLGGGGTGLAV